MGRKLVRWARAELLWAAAGFLLIQFALSLLIEAHLPQVCDPEFATKLDFLRARMAEAPDRPLVVALGKLRTLQGLDAGRLSNNEDSRRCVVFNMGLGGCGPVLQRVCFHRLREAGVRPDLILVEVLPAMLTTGDFPLVEDRYLDGARLRSSELASSYPYLQQPQRQLWKWLWGRLLPCSRHQAELRDRFALDRERSDRPVAAAGWSCDPYGWQAVGDARTPEQIAEAVAFSLGQYRDELHTSKLAANKVQALRDLLDDCRRDGIPVALVVMPESKAFRDLYLEGLDSHVTNLLDSLRREYGLLAVIDARGWIEDDGFHDAHHLAAAGAHVFADRFNREALRPLLARLDQKHQ